MGNPQLTAELDRFAETFRPALVFAALAGKDDRGRPLPTFGTRMSIGEDATPEEVISLLVGLRLGHENLLRLVAERFGMTHARLESEIEALAALGRPDLKGS